ncbi:MAG TPA: ATP-binding protein [Acetobacteraceae bacterium]|nr:ATP-binding protein [Acetobacteraceae bacterium]
MRILAHACGLAVAPIGALLVMLLAHWAAPRPALGAMIVIFAVALAISFVWTHRLDAVTDAVRRVAAEGGGESSARPALSSLGQLAREVERLSRRVASRAALVDQLQRADAAIVGRLPDPLIVLAADRSVRRANPAASKAFGDDMGAVLRHPLLREAIDRAFASGGVQGAELLLPVPVQRELQATVVPMDPPLADGGRAVVVLSDRTRERAVERMRADFVANASHELRTPLASLIGFVETLRGSAADDPEAQQRFLAIMAEQGARMNRLIDDLLSLSRIELTEHQPPSDDVDLTVMLPRQVAGYQPRLAESRARIEVAIADCLPPVLADADQLAQVLQNLLDNAVKYGRPDGTVKLLAQPAQAGGKWPSRPGVVLAVADQGAGIPREHIPRLTERFYRVDKGRSRAVGGTGLGLAIVKHIVNRHRGQLLIESEEGVGTTVSVWLPQSAPGPATQLAGSGSEARVP